MYVVDDFGEVGIVLFVNEIEDLVYECLVG